jgi:hypothetical protein
MRAFILALLLFAPQKDTGLTPGYDKRHDAEVQRVCGTFHSQTDRSTCQIGFEMGVSFGMIEARKAFKK